MYWCNVPHGSKFLSPAKPPTAASFLSVSLCVPTCACTLCQANILRSCKFTWSILKLKRVFFFLSQLCSQGNFSSSVKLSKNIYYQCVTSLPICSSLELVFLNYFNNILVHTALCIFCLSTLKGLRRVPGGSQRLESSLPKASILGI